MSISILLAVLLLTRSDSQATEPSALPAGDLAVVLAEERQRVEVIKQITPTVVCLFPKESTAGGGSGVLIDEDGFGLTNFHVVAPMLPDRMGDGGLADGTKYDVQVLGLDPHGDVAMFRVSGKKPLPAAALGDSDGLRVGDNCMALGNPFLLAEDFTPTVTFGIVSGLHRYQWGVGRALSYTDCIQVDTSINPGNSGGPLFDLAGRLLGINGRISIAERSRVNVGVGYAITINQIKRFIPALRAGLTTPHASAGFTVADASGRTIVNQILDDSAAYRAGLRLGDQILRFGTVEIRSANQFASQLGTYPAQWPIDLAYQRDGKTVKARVRLDELPLPDSKGLPPPAGRKKIDPFGQTPATQAANRKAVKRALELYRQYIGGGQAAASLRSIHATGSRRIAAKPQDEPQALDLFEERNKALASSGCDEVVRVIRWQLIQEVGEPGDRPGKVIRSDECGGRIGVVIERSMRVDGKDMPYSVCLDDSDGRLLAVEFTDSSSRRVRYEYGDERRIGPMKLPHKRRIFVDDALFAEDEFEKVQVSGA